MDIDTTMNGEKLEDRRVDEQDVWEDEEVGVEEGILENHLERAMKAIYINWHWTRRNLNVQAWTAEGPTAMVPLYYLQSTSSNEHGAAEVL